MASFATKQLHFVTYSWSDLQFLASQRIFKLNRLTGIGSLLQESCETLTLRYCCCKQAKVVASINMPFTTGSKCQVQTSSRPTTNLAPRSSRSNYAPSISSVLSSSSTLIPEAHQQRGFKTREAYLAALEEFAEGHLYMTTGDHTLKGFYGDKTMDFYKAKSSPMEDRKRRREQERRRTLPAILEDSVPVEDQDVVTESGQESPTFSESSAGTSEGETSPQGRRRSRFSKIFSGGRRGTVG